jgi:beta-galactosidase
MTKNQEPSRREFLSNGGKLVIGEALLSLTTTSGSAATLAAQSGSRRLIAKSQLKSTEFFFGASVYPELQTKDEWNRMLDHFQRAHMNGVRVSESSWGNLETAAGHYNFAWLHSFLDDLQKRNMKAILGTGSYIPPQWLAAGNPEILVQLHPGVRAHPMARHAPCLNHPLYRKALREYILALGKEFNDHPTVIAWQLGNEMEGSVTRICYNPACEKAWSDWLKKNYHTPEEFNRRLNLVSWGMKIRSLEEMPQPGEGVEESGKEIAALTLAHRHFRRDVLLDFFAMQAEALREAGVKHWITTDWNAEWLAVADDPQAGQIMDIAGLNYYQPWADNREYWAELAWHQDMHRSAYGRKHFITTESRFGVAGSTSIWDPFPSREQFHMWGLEAAAFGSSGLFYWTGNRWRGGHWPHWGGLLDWSGHPEPDFEWAIELGAIFQKWEQRLLASPVKAMVVALTDFEQRAALDVYSHIKSSFSLLPQCFDALHRLGIGVDSMNLATAENPANLQKYSLVLLPAATALDNPRAAAALKDFAQGGGVIIITPFTAYMDENGIFRGDGFASNLKELTGGLVRTVRWMGSAEASGRRGPQVEWKGRGMTGTSPVGLDGYCEFLEVEAEAESIASFKSEQAILNDKPAATERRLGRGVVVKLGFWPGDDSLLRLIRQLIPEGGDFLRVPLPPGALAVPHTDNSLFIVNTTGKEMAIELSRAASDRLSDIKFSGRTQLKPFQVVWLERTL